MASVALQARRERWGLARSFRGEASSAIHVLIEPRPAPGLLRKRCRIATAADQGEGTRYAHRDDLTMFAARRAFLQCAAVGGVRP